MKRQLLVLGATLLALAASILMYVRPMSAAVGLHVSGRNIVEANGQTFIMRGVNHPHVWFTNQTGSFANIKALGAITVRVVLGGKRWGPSTDVANVISLCKQNRLICVLEVHDTTGFGEDGAAASLDEAVNYWISQKNALVGQENYIVINIVNEPIGNNNAAQWTSATTAAIQKMRANGFERLLMVDGPNWGQDWQFVMRDNAQTILNADSRHNTVLSIHMYAVFKTAAAITDYLNRFQANGWPLVIGEFGWRFDASQVDHETLLSEAVSRGLGYLGWSWSGNTDPILDMATSFNPDQLTTWGQRIFNGANGIKSTAKEATIYGGGTPTPTATPTVTPPATPTGGARGCSATYAIVGQWSGGFQGEVRVTAGGTAINGWTVTWAYANGQTVTQAWNATVASSGSSVTARNVSYNGSLAASATRPSGSSGRRPAPTASPRCRAPPAEIAGAPGVLRRSPTWGEIETAYRWWADTARPHLTDPGLTAVIVVKIVGSGQAGELVAEHPTIFTTIRQHPGRMRHGGVDRCGQVLSASSHANTESPGSDDGCRLVGSSAMAGSHLGLGAAQ